MTEQTLNLDAEAVLDRLADLYLILGADSRRFRQACRRILRRIGA